MCPDAIILPSDYETYSILSERLYSIVRRFTSDVEEYGIDECFADITGLARPLHMNYEKIAATIKSTLDAELGFTFSIGLATTKVLAKIGSKWQKPSGLTCIASNLIRNFTSRTPVEKVWGIGPATTALLHKYGIYTAADFTDRPENWVKENFSKPFHEIYLELRGESTIPLVTAPKTSYASIQKVKTFTPPSSDREFVFSELAKNIENACIKARRYGLATAHIFFFLRTAEFVDQGAEIKLANASNIPNEIIPRLRPYFEKIFCTNKKYRTTGIVLSELTTISAQMDIFGAHTQSEKYARLYAGVDIVARKFGKHALYLGTSFAAHQRSAHLGDRGDIPTRHRALLPGETARKRLGIPMLMGKVF